MRFFTPPIKYSHYNTRAFRCDVFQRACNGCRFNGNDRLRVLVIVECIPKQFIRVRDNILPCVLVLTYNYYYTGHERI